MTNLEQQKLEYESTILKAHVDSIAINSDTYNTLLSDALKIFKAFKRYPPSEEVELD